MAALRSWTEPARRVSPALAVAVVCIVVTAGIVSCGNDEPRQADPSAGAAALSAGIITADEVSGKPADSPERTLFGWFQAIQFQDVSGASQFVDKPVLRGLGRGVFRAAVTTVGSALGRPKVVTSRQRGNQTAMRVLVQGYDAQGKVVTAQPATFYLRRSSAGWRISDLTYLLLQSNSIAAKAARDSG